MPLNRAGFARPTPRHLGRLDIATRPPSQAGDEFARLPRLHLEAPPHPLPRALRCACVGHRVRATPPADRAGDQPSRPVSLQRANLTGQPLRRPMAWRRAAYRRLPCPFMHSFCGVKGMSCCAQPAPALASIVCPKKRRLIDLVLS